MYNWKMAITRHLPSTRQAQITFHTYIFEWALKLNKDVDRNRKGTQTETSPSKEVQTWFYIIATNADSPLHILFTGDFLGLLPSYTGSSNGHYQGNKKFQAQIPHSEPCYCPTKWASLISESNHWILSLITSSHGLWVSCLLNYNRLCHWNAISLSPKMFCKLYQI